MKEKCELEGFQGLDVYQKATRLRQLLFELVQEFPGEDKYPLADQSSEVLENAPLPFTQIQVTQAPIPTITKLPQSPDQSILQAPITP